MLLPQHSVISRLDELLRQSVRSHDAVRNNSPGINKKYVDVRTLTFMALLLMLMDVYF